MKNLEKTTYFLVLINFQFSKSHFSAGFFCFSVCAEDRLTIFVISNEFYQFQRFDFDFSN
jgi:hypothetical protein